MTHELILQRENGSKVKITASISISFRDEKPSWTVTIETRQKGKIKWHNAYDEIKDNYDHRSLNMADRGKAKDEHLLKYATPEEILQAKRELWLKLEPTL